MFRYFLHLRSLLSSYICRRTTPHRTHDFIVSGSILGWTYLKRQNQASVLVRFGYAIPTPLLESLLGGGQNWFRARFFVTDYGHSFCFDELNRNSNCFLT